MIRELLKRPIAYQPIIAKATGSVTAAVVWSQLYYWHDKAKDGAGGWFYKTHDEMYDETGVTRRQQETVRELLQRHGLIEEELRGMPKKLHYRITDKNVDNLTKLISEHVSGPKEDKPFNMEEEILKLEANNKRRDFAIIALYFRRRKVKFDNAGEYQTALKRHLRAAKDLVPFGDDKLVDGCDRAAKATPDWTLETVIKILTK